MDDALALALLAAAAGNVEGEKARLVVALLGQRLGRIQLADKLENLEVGGGIASRGTPDGILIDHHHAGNLGHVARHAAATARSRSVGIAQKPRHRRIEDVGHQGALARSAHAGHHGETL